jgi:hypothetical protein
MSGGREEATFLCFRFAFIGTTTRQEIASIGICRESARGGEGRGEKVLAVVPNHPALLLKGGEAIKFTTASTFNAAMNLNFVKGNFSTATTAT